MDLARGIGGIGRVARAAGPLPVNRRPNFLGDRHGGDREADILALLDRGPDEEQRMTTDEPRWMRDRMKTSELEVNMGARGTPGTR